MSRHELIDAEKATYPVSALRRVLGVSRSGFHEKADYVKADVAAVTALQEP
jgi:hypothetical protein